MGVENTFRVAVSTEAKIAVDKGSLDSSASTLDSFYNKYNNKKIEIGIDKKAFNNDVNTLNKNFQRAVVDAQKYIKKYNEVTSSSTSWLNADPNKAAYDNRISMIRNMFKDVRVAFKDGTSLVGFDEIFKDIGGGLTQFESKLSEGISFVDLGNQVDYLRGKEQELVSTIKELVAVDWRGNLFLNKNDLNVDQIEHMLGLLKELQVVQAGLDAFSIDKLKSKDFASGFATDSIEYQSKNLESDLQEMREYNIETRSLLRERQDIISEAQDYMSWDEDDQKAAKKNINDHEEYENNINNLKDYISSREELLQKLYDNKSTLFSNDDDFDSYVTNVKEQLNQYKQYLQELQDFKVKSDSGTPFGLDFTEVVNALKEVKQAVEEIKTALDPLTTALATEGTAFNSMAQEGAASLDTLLEKLIQVSTLVDSLNKKDFNIVQNIGTDNVLEQVQSLRQQIETDLVSIRTMIENTFDFSTVEPNYENIKAVTDNIYKYFEDLQTKINSLEFNIPKVNSNDVQHSADKTADAVEGESQEVVDAGQKFEQVAAQKRQFADANKEVAASAVATEGAVKDATASIAAGGKTLDKTKNVYVNDVQKSHSDVSSERTKNSYRNTTTTTKYDQDGNVESVTETIVNDMKKLRDEQMKQTEKNKRAQAKLQKYINGFNSKTAGRASEFSVDGGKITFDDLANFKIVDADSLEQAIVLMDKFEAEYNKVISNIRKGGSSMNPFVNMENAISNIGVTKRNIDLAFDSLSAPTKELREQYEKLPSLINNVNTAKTIEERAKAYGTLKEAISNVTSEIQIQKREEAAINKNDKLKSDIDRQFSLLTKQQAQWKKNGQLTDEVNKQIEDAFESLSNVSNASELTAWKQQWMYVKDAVATTKYEIEAASKAQSEAAAATNAERQASGKYWDNAFKESVNDLITPKNRPELEQLKLSMLQQAESTKESVMEQYDAIMTIVSKKNNALQKLMAAKGPEEQQYWQNEYNTWSDAWEDISLDVNVSDFFEDASNQAILGENNIKKFNEQLERSEALSNKVNDSKLKKLDGLYNDLAKSQGNIDKLQAQLDSGKLGAATAQIVQDDLAAEKNKYTEIQQQISGYGELVDAERQALIIEEERKRVAKEITDANAKTVDKEIERQNKANQNYGKSTYNSAERKYGQIIGQMESLEITNPQVLAQFDAYKQKLEELKRLRDQFANNPNVKNDSGLVAQFQKAAKEADNAYKEIKEVLDVSEELQNLSEKSKLGESSLDDIAGIDNASKMKNYINTIADGRVEIKGWNADQSKMYASIDNGKGIIDDVTVALDKNKKALIAYKTETQNVGTAWDQLKSGITKKFKEVVNYTVGAASMYEVFNQIRTGVNYVREIDVSLTELKKVTDETDATYSKFLHNMSQVAGVVGSTTSELTNSAAAWARLGYSIEEAGELAKNTAILMNVSEFDNVDEATEALISSLQAFDYEASDSIEIVDKLNIVGNNFAISSDGLASGLQRSASTLVAAGNSLEQSIAMLAAGNKVIQDPEALGNALKVLSMRIRGTKTELEEAGESTDGMIENTSKLRDKVKALTNVDGSGGVDILTSSGEFRSTYDILLDIANVWDRINETDPKNQAALLEILAGKTRGSQVAAVLQNAKDLKDAYDMAMNSDGSAFAENERYLDSIQGRIDILKNSIQTMWTNAISSDTVKGFVDVGNALVQIVDKLGLIPTLLGAASAAFSAISNKNLFVNIQPENNSFKSIFSGALSSGFSDIVSKAKEAKSAIISFNEAQDNIAKSNVLNGLNATNRGLHDYIVAQLQANVATNGGTVSQRAYAISLIKTAAKTLLAKTATIALNAALTMCIAAIAGFAVNLVVKGIDDVIHHAENLKTEVKDITSTYKDAKKEFGDNLASLSSMTDTGNLSDLESEFARLTAGVNHNGENISLTADEYERYKSICEKIVDINPSLAVGYDDAAQAIGHQKDALSDLIEAQKAQARLNAKEYVKDDNLKKIAEDSINDYQNVVREFNKIKNNPIEENLSDAFSTDDLKNNIALKLAEISGLQKEYSNYFGSGKFTNQQQVLDAQKGFIDKYSKEISKSLKNADEETIKNLNDLYDIDILGKDNFKKSLSEYESNLGEAEKKLKQAQDGLIYSLLQVPQSMEEYESLSKSGKSFITEWIKNSDAFKIDEKTSETTILKMKKTIRDMVENLDVEGEVKDAAGETVTTTAQDIFDSIFEIDPSSINHADYKKKMNDLLNLLWQLPGFDKLTSDQKTQIKISLGIEYDVEGEGGKTPEQTLVDRLDEVVTDDGFKAQEFVDGLSETEVQAALKIDWTAQSNMTQDEVKKMLKNDAQDKVYSVQSYDELKSSIENANTVLNDNSYALVDNVKLTQEQCDSISKLIDNEEELNKCIDKENGNIVTNSALLRALIKNKQNDLKSTILQAKANAVLQYIQTFKAIQALKSSEIEKTANMQVTSVLKEQLSTLEQVIQAYARLEAQASKAGQMYSEYDKAKSRDSELTYDESFLDALKSIDNGILSGKVGTEEFEAAVNMLVPKEAYAGLDNIDDKIHAIHDYVDGNPLLADWFTVKKDGSFDITIDNVRNFADTLKGLGEEYVNVDENGNFTFTDKIKDMSHLTDLLNKDLPESQHVTESAVLAMISAFEDFDGTWSNMLADIMTNPLDRAVNQSLRGITETEEQIDVLKSNLKEAQDAKYNFLQSGGNMNSWQGKKLQKEIDDTVKKIEEAETKLAELNKEYNTASEKAGENAQDWASANQLLGAARGEMELTKEQATQLCEELGWIDKSGNPKIEIDDNGVVQSEENLKKIQELLALIEKPTVVGIQLANENLHSELDSLIQKKQELEQLKSHLGYGADTSDIDAQLAEVETKINAKKQDIEDFELFFNVKPVEGAEDGLASIITTIEQAQAKIKEISDTPIVINSADVTALTDSVNTAVENAKTKISEISQAASKAVTTTTTSLGSITETQVAVTNIDTSGLTTIQTEAAVTKSALEGIPKETIKVAATSTGFQNVADDAITTKNAVEKVPKKVKVKASAPGLETAADNAERLATAVTTCQENSNIDITSNADGVTESVEALGDSLTALPTPPPIVITDNADDAKAGVDSLHSSIDALHDKTITITTVYRTVGSPGGGGAAGGGGGGGAVSLYAGNAFAQGNAHADGKIGLPKAEKNSLVGELGTELVVANGRYYTVGENGAEFVDLPRDAIIFNHLQTKSLLEHGYTNSRGQGRGKLAFAEGNAHYGIVSWHPSDKDTSFANGSEMIDWGEIANGMNGAAGGLAGAAEALEEDSEKIVDFIEYKLEEIEHVITRATNKIENLLDNTTQTSEKKDLYDALIEAEKAKADTYLGAVSVYNKKASELLDEVPSEYRELAKNGALAITDFIGEEEGEIASAIEKYREFANKANDAENGYLETIAEISEKRLEQLEDIASDFENVIGLTDSHSDIIQAQMDLIEESGNRLSEKYYEDLKESSENKIQEMQKEREELQKILDDSVASGDVQVGSDDWYEMVNAIYDVDESIIDCKTDIEEFQNSINDLYWDNLEKFISNIESVESELSNLFDLISDEDKVVDESGNWTKDGITALGLLAQQMETAQFKTKQYGEAIDRLNKDYADGKYSTDEYNEKLAELKENQWDSINAYEDAKEAIIDLNRTRVEAIKTGIDKEIEALDKLISKKKQELSIQKD